MNLFKKAILGLLCGLTTGAVILGVGGRMVMSGIALLEHNTPAWSLGGSIEVILFGALIGAVVGMVYTVAGPQLPGSPLGKGLLAGLLLVGGMVLLPPPSARSAMTGFGHLLLPIVLMFAVLTLAFGVTLALLMDVLMKRGETEKK